MKIKTKTITENDIQLDNEFEILKKQLNEKDFYYQAICRDSKSKDEIIIGNEKNISIDDLGIEIKNFLFKANPVSIETSFTEDDNTEKNYVKFLKLLLNYNK